jgi:hypothetical protein
LATGFDPTRVEPIQTVTETDLFYGGQLDSRVANLKPVRPRRQHCFRRHLDPAVVGCNLFDPDRRCSTVALQRGGVYDRQASTGDEPQRSIGRFGNRRPSGRDWQSGGTVARIVKAEASCG